MAKKAGLFSNKAKTAKERTLVVNSNLMIPPTPRPEPITVPASDKKYFLKRMTYANEYAKNAEELAKQSQQLANQSQQMQAKFIEEKTKAFACLEVILEEYGFTDPENWSYDDATGLLTRNSQTPK